MAKKRVAPEEVPQEQAPMQPTQPPFDVVEYLEKEFKPELVKYEEWQITSKTYYYEVKLPGGEKMTIPITVRERRLVEGRDFKYGLVERGSNPRIEIAFGTEDNFPAVARGVLKVSFPISYEKIQPDLEAFLKSFVAMQFGARDYAIRELEKVKKDLEARFGIKFLGD